METTRPPPENLGVATHNPRIDDYALKDGIFISRAKSPRVDG